MPRCWMIVAVVFICGFLSSAARGETRAVIFGLSEADGAALLFVSGDEVVARHAYESAPRRNFFDGSQFLAVATDAERTVVFLKDPAGDVRLHVYQTATGERTAQIQAPTRVSLVPITSQTVAISPDERVVYWTDRSVDEEPWTLLACDLEAEAVTRYPAPAESQGQPAQVVVVPEGVAVLTMGELLTVERTINVQQVRVFDPEAEEFVETVTLPDGAEIVGIAGPAAAILRTNDAFYPLGRTSAGTFAPLPFEVERGAGSGGGVQPPKAAVHAVDGEIVLAQMTVGRDNRTVTVRRGEHQNLQSRIQIDDFVRAMALDGEHLTLLAVSNSFEARILRYDWRSGERTSAVDLEQKFHAATQPITLHVVPAAEIE